MPPFRPANLNKRAYPGNASVIGPTRTATVGFTTSCVGFTTTASCGSCTNCGSFVLGCRFGGCICPCCCLVCACPETLCTRTIPSGRWKASEQYEAATRFAWGVNTCSCGSPICLCCTDVGFALGGGAIDCKGFFICCGPSTNKWFVAPSCTQVIRSWYTRNDAVTVACSCMGNCGWFVPTCGQIQNPGYCCRTYWDSYSTDDQYQGDVAQDDRNAFWVSMVNGVPANPYNFPSLTKNFGKYLRSFRCTVS